MVATQDLVFTENSFFYPLDKSRAFRNYLSIMVPEIVNMPVLGFDTKLLENLKTYLNNTIDGIGRPDPKTQLVINSILYGAQNYNIAVISYNEVFFNESNVLVFTNISLA